MESEELTTYKQAVWDFLLEHCDITPNGSLFIKFHASSRNNIEKRIKARWKYKYHREDVRKKGKKVAYLKQKFMDEKIAKVEKYNNERAKRRKRYNANFLWKIYYKIIDKYNGATQKSF